MKNAVQAPPNGIKYLEPYQEFSKALVGVKKTVEIAIDLNDLKTLKDAHYRLCFAKKIGDKAYNVVWQSYSDYLYDNKFSWTPQFQLFGSNEFKTDIQVNVSTNLVDIELGETSVLNPEGILGMAVTGGPATAFTLDNEYQPIHAGVNQLSTGLDGNVVSTPIYVSVDQVITGATTLTPVEKVLVWFEQDIETSTMFSKSRSKAIEIDLTEVNSASRLYKDGAWQTP